MEQGYLLPEQAFTVLGMLLCLIYLTLMFFFFEKVEYNILQFVFILLPASVGIVSFGVIPIAAIINIIPSLITPNKVGLIIEALGLYIAICTVLALNLSTNKLKESK